MGRARNPISQTALDVAMKRCRYPKEAETYRPRLKGASLESCKNTPLSPGLYAKLLLAEFWVCTQLPPLCSQSQAGQPSLAPIFLHGLLSGL